MNGTSQPYSDRRTGHRSAGAALVVAAVLASSCTAGGAGGGTSSAASGTHDGASSFPSPSSNGSAGAPTSASSTSSASGASYEAAPCPNPIVPNFAQFDLGSGYECGYLTVPEDRTQPNGKTIRLAVARAPATSATPAGDPLLYLTGGPGGSALLAAAPSVAAGWNADRDVIFLEQRGTLKSEPLLACPEVDAFLAEWVTLDTLDPATAEKSGVAMKACRDRLTGEGIDVSAFNTTENAADVADLRVAMGVDAWSLYGVSYGTDLALQTLRDHPEGIRSVVLDGVVPPQDNLLGDWWPSAADGISAIFDACAAASVCQEAYPTVRQDFFALVDELAVQPRTVTVQSSSTQQDVAVVIDGYKLANLVLSSSLVPGGTAPIPALIDNLRRGDGTQAAERLITLVGPPGLVGYGLSFGVFCSEHAPFTSPDQIAATGRNAGLDFPDVVLRHTPQSPFIFSDCQQWDVPAADPAVAEPVTSDVPALLLSGRLDAVTAPRNADTVAAGFPNHTNLVFPDSGHAVTAWSPICGVAVMNSFLRNPESVDDACVAALTPSFDGG